MRLSSKIANTVYVACMILGGGCTDTNSTRSDVPILPADAARPSPPDDALAPWGAGCNHALLARPYSLKNANDFKLSQSDLKRITEVIEEVRGGYGGTLVTATRDDVLDSSAFLAHYLRAFAEPVDVAKYDYRFERILSRLAETETVLDDRRLDWDIWRAYLLYEDFAAGRDDGHEYKVVEGGDTYVHRLDSAKDLLWAYLDRNATSIREDPERLRSWIDSLTLDMQAPGGRPMRRWFLLQLVALSDTKTATLIDDPAETENQALPLLESDPFHPFIVLDGAALFSDDDGDQSAFVKAIGKIAASQNLSFEIWGIDPATMPPTKAVMTDLAPRLSQFSLAKVLSQESWSNKPHYFSVSFSRPIGRRSTHFNVRMPTHDSKDGVFFFTYDARLYVWPKSKMDAAVIQMLHVSRLIDDATHAQFQAKGFNRLTITSNRWSLDYF